MIRLTVLYPNLKGSTFDWDYYINVHTALAKKLFGDVAVRWEVDKGLAGESAMGLAPYQVAAFITMTSLEDFRRVMEEHGAELKADFVNYTNVYPQFLISEVAVT